MDKHVSRNTSSSSSKGPLLLLPLSFSSSHIYTLATRRVVTVDSDGVLWHIHLRVYSLCAGRAHSDHSDKNEGEESDGRTLFSLCNVRRVQA